MSRDEAQLLDMLLAGQKIQRYATGLDGAAFLVLERLLPRSEQEL